MSEENKQREMHYSNGEITVVWKPWLCQHSTHCWQELPAVFHPRNRPWITVEQAATEQIVAQVAKCPSGALSILQQKNEAVD